MLFIIIHFRLNIFFKRFCWYRVKSPFKNPYNMLNYNYQYFYTLENKSFRDIINMEMLGITQLI